MAIQAPITSRLGLELLEDSNIRGLFWDMWEGNQAPPWVEGITGAPIPSDASKEEYGFFSNAPVLQPSTGQKRVSRMSADAFEIANSLFDAAVGVPREKWRRDRTGRIQRTMVQELVERSQTHWARPLTTLIENGASTTTPIDGANFFSASHLAGDFTGQKNLLTASDYAELAIADLTNQTSDEMANAIYAVISQFFALVDDQGEPRNENANRFVVMVPQKWMRAARAAASLRLVTDGSKTIDNALLEAGYQITLATNPRLTTANNYLYAFRDASDGTFSALVRQSEKLEGGVEVKFDFFGMDTEYARLNNEVMASVECSRAVGYGDWWRAIRAEVSEAS